MTASKDAQEDLLVYFLYHILNFSGVLGQKGICRFEEFIYYCFEQRLLNLFVNERIEVMKSNESKVKVALK